MLYHNDYIHRVYLQCVIFYALIEYYEVQKFYHSHYIHRVSLQHVLFMSLKTTMIHKDFTTLIIYLMFLSSMGSFMLSEANVICKGFIPLITFIGFLSSMASFMP